MQVITKGELKEGIIGRIDKTDKIDKTERSNKLQILSPFVKDKRGFKDKAVQSAIRLNMRENNSVTDSRTVGHDWSKNMIVVVQGICEQTEGESFSSGLQIKKVTVIASRCIAVEAMDNVKCTLGDFEKQIF